MRIKISSATLVALTLGLYACGGGGDDSSPTPPPPPPPPASDTAPPSVPANVSHRAKCDVLIVHTT